ncbi:uncharacterized protein LOC143030715 [Oratosquilla oratoria]|uniref:uncharacterized protein LOC143030715 n=1 Tax=Oratosquilla oratoria TaxID=337810 RepID=UPI003F762F4B
MNADPAPVGTFHGPSEWIKPRENPELGPAEYPEPFIQHYDPALEYEYSYYDTDLGDIEKMDRVEAETQRQIRTDNNQLVRSFEVDMEPASSNWEASMSSALSAFASLNNMPPLDSLGTGTKKNSRSAHVERAFLRGPLAHIRSPPVPHQEFQNDVSLHSIHSVGRYQQRPQNFLAPKYRNPQEPPKSNSFEKFEETTAQQKNLFKKNQPNEHTFRPSTLITDNPDTFQPVTRPPPLQSNTEQTPLKQSSRPYRQVEQQRSSFFNAFTSPRPLPFHNNPAFPGHVGVTPSIPSQGFRSTSAFSSTPIINHPQPFSVHHQPQTLPHQTNPFVQTFVQSPPAFNPNLAQAFTQNQQSRPAAVAITHQFLGHPDPDQRRPLPGPSNPLSVDNPNKRPINEAKPFRQKPVNFQGVTGGRPHGEHSPFRPHPQKPVVITSPFRVPEEPKNLLPRPVPHFGGPSDFDQKAQFEHRPQSENKPQFEDDPQFVGSPGFEQFKQRPQFEQKITHETSQQPQLISRPPFVHQTSQFGRHVPPTSTALPLENRRPLQSGLEFSNFHNQFSQPDPNFRLRPTAVPTTGRHETFGSTTPAPPVTVSTLHPRPVDFGQQEQDHHFEHVTSSTRLPALGEEEDLSTFHTTPRRQPPITPHTDQFIPSTSRPFTDGNEHINRPTPRPFLLEEEQLSRPTLRPVRPLRAQGQRFGSSPHLISAEENQVATEEGQRKATEQPFQQPTFTNEENLRGDHLQDDLPGTVLLDEITLLSRDSPIDREKTVPHRSQNVGNNDQVSPTAGRRRRPTRRPPSSVLRKSQSDTNEVEPASDTTVASRGFRRRPGNVRNRITSRLATRRQRLTTTTESPGVELERFPDEELQTVQNDLQDETEVPTETSEELVTTEAPPSTTPLSSFRQRVRDRLNRLRNRNNSSHRGTSFGAREILKESAVQNASSTTSTTSRPLTRPTTSPADRLRRYRNRLRRPTRQPVRSRTSSNEASETTTLRTTDFGSVTARQRNDRINRPQIATAEESNVSQASDKESEKEGVLQIATAVDTKSHATNDIHRKSSHQLLDASRQGENQTKHETEDNLGADEPNDEEEVETESQDNVNEDTGPDLRRRPNNPRVRARFQEFIKNRKNRLSARYRTTAAPVIRKTQATTESSEGISPSVEPQIDDERRRLFNERRQAARRRLIANRARANEDGEERVSRRVPFRSIRNRLQHNPSKEKPTQEHINNKSELNQETEPSAQVSNTNANFDQETSASSGAKFNNENDDSNIEEFKPIVSPLSVPVSKVSEITESPEETFIGSPSILSTDKTLAPKRFLPEEPDIITAAPPPDFFTITVNSDLLGGQRSFGHQTQLLGGGKRIVNNAKLVSAKVPEQTIIMDLVTEDPSEQSSPSEDPSNVVGNVSLGNKHRSFLTEESKDAQITPQDPSTLKENPSTLQQEDPQGSTTQKETSVLVTQEPQDSETKTEVKGSISPEKSQDPVRPRPSRPTFHFHRSSTSRDRPNPSDTVFDIDTGTDLNITPFKTERETTSKFSGIDSTRKPFLSITMATDSPRLPIEFLLPFNSQR